MFNVSGVTIALVSNVSGDRFLWLVDFLTFRFFISFSISDWEASVNENLFPRKIWSLIIRALGWVLNFSLTLATGSFKLSETLFVMQVFSAIFKDLTVLEKKRFNYSAIWVSSFRISSSSVSFTFLPKVLLFVKMVLLFSKKSYYWI